MIQLEKIRIAYDSITLKRKYKFDLALIDAAIEELCARYVLLPDSETPPDILWEYQTTSLDLGLHYLYMFCESSPALEVKGLADLACSLHKSITGKRLQRT